MKKIIILLFVSFVFGQSQSKPEISFVKTGKGLLLVFNQPKNYFTIEFFGENVKPLESENLMINVDNNLIQLLTVPTSNFIKADTNRSSSKILLKEYLQYEMSYLEKVLKTELEAVNKIIGDTLGHSSIYWEFEFPQKISKSKDSNSDPVKKQIFSVTHNNEYVIVLNSFITESENNKSKKDLFQSICNSIKFDNSPIDANIIGNQLKKEMFIDEINKNPNDPILNYKYAKFLIEVDNNVFEAVKYFEKAIEAKPTISDIYRDYAFVCANYLYDSENAKKYYNKALSMNPKDNIALVNYAVFLIDFQSEYEEAEKLFIKALKIDDKFAQAHYYYAELLMKYLNNTKKAQEHLKKAKELGFQ